MSDTAPEAHVEEVIHIAPKHRDADGPAITGTLLERMEDELNDALRVAGDTAPRLMYQMVDVEPTSLDAFVRHHAGHFERNVITGGDQVEVCAVLLRHAFIVGVLAQRAVHRAQVAP